MPQLHLYDVGDYVVTTETPKMMGQIRSISQSSISMTNVRVIGGRQLGDTTWSPFTQVRKAYEDVPPQKHVEPSQPTTATTPSQPTKSKEKAKTEPKEPKPKAAVDAFGVKQGSMAAAVNAYLLEKRKGITVVDILANVKGSKKDNVVSHLRRMIKDKLIINKGEGKDLLVSVPKGVK